jgi:hypothetical protein
MRRKESSSWDFHLLKQPALKPLLDEIIYTTTIMDESEMLALCFFFFFFFDHHTSWYMASMTFLYSCLKKVKNYKSPLHFLSTRLYKLSRVRPIYFLFYFILFY